MERKSGVLMHISSLYGDYSIGSLGKSAREFVDFLSYCNFSYWQTLPFCMTDKFNSPYHSHSAFSLNPYFIDLEILFDKGLCTKGELNTQKQFWPYSCEYERLNKNRLDFLRMISKRVEHKDEIASFIKSKKHIEDFCIFMALKEGNDNNKWNKWNKNTYQNETLFMWEFIHYEFLSQWSEIKSYANKKGIKIIGDIPIYVSYDSSDVWANKNLFLLDDNNYPLSVAGVPPDYFSPLGQLWGNPLYNWTEMEKDGYKWWVDRIEHTLDMFDAIRIDHFRGFESYWSVNYGEKTAKNGKWVKGPGMKLISKINKIASQKLIIAEDLGFITPEVKKLLEDSSYPGTRVFQFAFLDDSDNVHLPHNYTNNTVAYTGTHDNNTLLGYMWELDINNKKRMLDYCNYHLSEWEKGIDSIIRTIYASSAGIVMFPIQDLLLYGSDTRINTPGKTDDNWRFRITKEQLLGIDKEKYKHYNEIYKRI